MKKSFALLLAAVMLLALCGCGAEAPVSAPETTAAAETQAPTEQETVPATTEAAFDLTTWQGNYDLGLSYLDSKDWQQAYDAFDAAVALDPQKADAYARRGLARVCLEETEENLSLSWEDYQQALTLDENCALAYRGIADVHIRRGEYDEALAVAVDAKEKINDDSSIRFELQRMENGEFYDSSNMMRFSRRKYYYKEQYIGRVDVSYDENGNGKFVEVFNATDKSIGSFELGTIVDGNTKIQNSFSTLAGASGVSISKRINTTVTSADGSYEYETVAFNTKGNVEFSTREWYDINGRIIRREDYNAVGELKGYTTSEYDEAGNEIRCNHYNPDGTLHQFNLLDYDSEGKLLRMDYRDANGDLLTYILYIYDENGNHIGEESYNADGVLEHSAIG